MNRALHVTEAERSPQPQAPLKFAYASGAKPLPGYTIKRGVGRGGFGEVYYALSDAGKEVAIKLIRRNLDVELRGVTHCLNLKHPNLVVLFDIKQDDEDNSWVVMEYVSGESLEHAIARHPEGMPPEEALGWIHGIAAGVAYLHDHGIVHRDLKPGNIFLDEGVVKLGDYGLSKFISCSRRSGQTESVGTVHYMAPEIANGRYGKEIDLYALGVVLYEMLTGRVPFEGESVGEVLMKHLTAEADLAPLAEPYRTVIGRALAKDPEVRYRSVKEFMAELPAAPTIGSAFAKYPQVRPGMTSGDGHAPFREEATSRPAPDPNASAPPRHEDAVVTVFRQAGDAVHNVWSRSGTFARVALVVGVVLLLSRFAGISAISMSPFSPFEYSWFAVLLVLLAVGFVRLVGGKHATRQGGQASHEKPVPRTDVRLAPGVAEVKQPEPIVLTPQQLGEKRSPQLPVLAVARPPREQLAELAGSLLLSAVVSAAMALVMVFLRGAVTSGEQYAWLFLTSGIGSWAVLIVSKFWERSSGEVALRRFGMLLLGLGFGEAAYGLSQALMVQLPFELTDERGRFGAFASLARRFYDDGGNPLSFAYMAYFGFLFLLIRWWLQTDPLRQSRVSAWATLCTVAAAGLLNLVWPFPQPWGLMVAATISIAVQLSSPWVPPQKRPRRRPG